MDAKVVSDLHFRLTIYPFALPRLFTSLNLVAFPDAV
jgi:hypothetical protein